MGDDHCKPHEHYGRGECVRHHYYPDGTGQMRCPGCGNRVQSVHTRDVARKHQNRFDW